MAEACSINNLVIQHTKLCGNQLNVAEGATVGLNSVCGMKIVHDSNFSNINNGNNVPDCTSPFTVNIYTDAAPETTATISGGNRGYT